ncbi:AGAP008170-PA-like protein [Anopheles sinensis]|uniref:AGAP008170-PA-like protein n=1 Tax=Anopheles sinensis TaxID=74873 RepID=A0A084VB59_ANOSI|nr:AGAP008170-PA-like protein [Anopheles sinensis]
MQFRCVVDICEIKNLSLSHDGTFAFTHLYPGVKVLNLAGILGDTLCLVELVNLTTLQHFMVEDSQLTAINLTLKPVGSTVQIVATPLRSITFFQSDGIREVTIERTHLDSIPVTLYEQSSLELLSIQRSRIRTVNFDLLASLPHLRLVNLSDNKIHKLSIDQHQPVCYRSLQFIELQGMPYLDYVSLRQNRLRSIENTASRAPVDPCHGDPKYHHETATFGSILSIDLVGNRLTVVNFSIFTPMHNLNKLFLGHNSLTEMYATEDQLPDGLEYIDLSFNQLSAKADFGALISVKSLDVDSNQDRS